MYLWTEKSIAIKFYKKLIRRRDSERSGTDKGHTVFIVNRKPSITTGNHHNGKAKLKR